MVRSLVSVLVVVVMVAGRVRVSLVLARFPSRFRSSRRVEALGRTHDRDAETHETGQHSRRRWRTRVRRWSWRISARRWARRSSSWQRTLLTPRGETRQRRQAKPRARASERGTQGETTRRHHTTTRQHNHGTQARRTRACRGHGLDFGARTMAAGPLYSSREEIVVGCVPLSGAASLGTRADLEAACCC